MNRSTRAAAATFLTFLLAFGALTAFASEQTMTFDEALAAAKERDSVVVVDFFTDWCVYCKQFDKALAEPESHIADALEPVVFLSIDAEKGEGIGLAKKFGVSGFPTYTVLNAAGELIESWAGFGGPDHFISSLNTALADPTTYAEKQARFEAEPTAELAQTLSRIAASSGQAVQGMEYMKQAEALDENLDLTEDLLMAAFSAARAENDFTVADYVDVARERVIDGDVAPMTTLITTYYLGNLTADEEDHASVKPFLTKSREVIAEGGNLNPDLVSRIELSALLWLDNDVDGAVAYKRASMPEGWKENAGALNDFAWWCFENRVNLEEAQQLAMKGVEIAEPGKERATVLDTAAELCNVLGNCNEAVLLSQRAIQDDPANEYYTKQLKRFEELQAAAE